METEGGWSGGPSRLPLLPSKVIYPWVINSKSSFPPSSLFSISVHTASTFFNSDKSALRKMNVPPGQILSQSAMIAAARG